MFCLDLIGDIFIFCIYCLIGVVILYCLVNVALLSIWIYRIVKTLFTNGQFFKLSVGVCGLFLFIGFLIVGVLWKGFLEPIGQSGNPCSIFSALSMFFPAIGIGALVRLLTMGCDRDSNGLTRTEAYLAFTQLLGCAVSYIRV